MKKRVWIVSPYFIIVSILMFAMSFIALLVDIKIFVISLVISILSTVFSLVGMFRFKHYIKFVLNDTLSTINSQDLNVFKKTPIPAIIVGINEEIIWINSHFKNKIGNGRDCVGEKIDQFISDKTLDEILEHKGVDISYAGRRYTVFGVQMQKSSVIYFIDDTYYKETTLEYLESRPVVCLVVFDNREEILRDSTDGEDSNIVATVNNKLHKWAENTSGFIKKLDGNRYMMVTEERYIKAFIKEKFKILEEIRSINLGDRRQATISIGIGRGASNLKESEMWAKKALDMALGRGGDQVAIKQGASYSFFGGVSKGTEKRDKVRTRVIASTLADYIKSSELVLIMGHQFSDLDSVGAAIGMWSVVNKGLNKLAYIVINKDQSLAKPIIKLMKSTGNSHMFIDPVQAMSLAKDDTLLIIVDTHSQHFLESKEVFNLCKNIVVIDHHRMMVNHIRGAVVFYHEPNASSASEMVTELVQYLGENSLDNFEAEALLSGIMLDTKNFVLRTGVRTFEAAAFLRRKGADTIEVKRLFSNSFDTYKEKSQLIANAEIFNNCAIACAFQDYPDVRVSSAQAADELLGIQGVKASFVMYPSEDDTVNISARSMGDVNVQLIMEELGGGGHHTMAGAQIKNTNIDQVREKLIEIISGIKT